jgi:D-alanyl-D-alanine endopeptidase (penicillin-binding protein 7)
MLAETFLTLLGTLTIQTAHAQTNAPLLASLPVAKYAAPTVVGPVRLPTASLGVETTARAATVVDVASGEVLYEKDAEAVYPVASLTKLVTAMTFLDTKPNFEDPISVLQEDETSDGHSPFATPESMTKREAFDAMLVGSINSIGNAIARSSEGGREAFIKRMNEKAQSLGMTQTDFHDPTGLDEHSRSTAHDMAIALRAALMYPEIRDATGMQKTDVHGLTNTNKKYTIKTTNLLLSSFLNKKPYQIVAGKTGSLPQAGFCLAQATRDQNGNEVIAVVLGSENHFARFQDAKSLTYWAFTSYEWPRKTADSH